MKARSVVFAHIQHPATIFGLPPLLSIISMTAGAVAYVLSVIAGAVPIALIVAALVTALGLFKTYRLGRIDRHVESVFLTAINFWGLSSHRGLLTGAFPRRSHGGRS